MAGVANGAVRYVEEYLAGTNRGGGWMKRDTSLASANEGDTFDHNTEVGGWVRLRDGRPRNLNDFGVYGNGVTNDRAAIVAFRNAGGGYINPGTYLEVSAIPATTNGSWMEGVDRDQCVFTGNVQYGMIKLGTKDKVLNLSIENTNANAQCVSWERHVSFADLKFCRLKGASAVGCNINIGPINDCDIESNHMDRVQKRRLNERELG